MDIFSKAFILLIWLSVVNCNRRTDELRSQLSNDLTALVSNKSAYDRAIFPPRTKGPVNVTVSLGIFDIQEISETTMTYKLEVHLHQSWQDLRLTVDKEEYRNLTPIFMHRLVIESFWNPETYFSNSLESIYPDYEGLSGTHRRTFAVDAQGNVITEQRFSLKTNCKMELNDFPFDHQKCQLRLENYGAVSSLLQYVWKQDDPIYFRTISLRISDFTLKNTSTASQMYKQKTGVVNSVLLVCFQFERNVGFYFLELYIPASLIVVVAFLSSAGSHNFSDLVGVLMAQLFLFFSYVSFMPKVSYVKAMDVYMIACFVFILVTLIESFMSVNKEDEKAGDMNNPIGKPNLVFIKNKCTQTENKEEYDRLLCKRARKVADSAYQHRLVLKKAVLPFLFVLFNVIYFYIYAYVLEPDSQLECP